MRRILATTMVLTLLVQAMAQVPAQPQTQAILVTGATVHVGNGQVIENGAVGFDNGKIIFAGKASEADRSAYAEVVDATGKHVYPGFILPNSSLGLVEIGALRQTRDNDETGTMNPNVRALVAYNSDTYIGPTLRANGVLLAQSTPRGGMISGTSSIMELDGWNWEDAAFKADDGLHLNWPVSKYRGSAWRGEEGIQENKQKAAQLENLGLFFDRARAYAGETKPAETNVKLEAMRGLYDGSKTLYIHVNVAKDIMESVLFAESRGVKKIVVVEAADAWMITDFLKAHSVAVILRRVHELPMREDEDIDQPFKTASALQKSGVLYCLNYSGDMEPAGGRNLPFTAGTAVAYGLTMEEAVQSITLNPARILGIDQRVGSLEKGKDATLFISAGDALDMRSNRVEKAFIRGKSLDLDTYQKALYRKYAGKYKLEVKE